MEQTAMQSYRAAREQRQREEDDMFNFIREHGSPQERSREVVEHRGSYDESGVTRIVIEAHIAMTREQVNVWAREQYDTHCQHSYDCCGRTYGSVLTNRTMAVRRDIANSTRLWAIEWSWGVNV